MIDQNRLNVIAADLKHLRPGLEKHSLAIELASECRSRGLEHDLKTIRIAVTEVLHLKECA